MCVCIYEYIYLDLVIQYEQNRMYFLYRKQKKNSKQKYGIAKNSPKISAQQQRNQSFQSQIRTTFTGYFSSYAFNALSRVTVTINTATITRLAKTIHYSFVRK